MAAVILEEANARSILHLVEFYFSDSNLPRHGFLRKAVDESQDGLVSLALICSFGRMRSILGLDNDTKPESVPVGVIDAVSEVLKSRSTTLRISDDGKKVGRIAELLKPEELIEQLDSCTIAASPFPYDTTLEDVETFFSKQAKVNSVRLPKHVSDKRYFCRTALIEFSEEEDAKKILEENLVFAGAELALKSKKEYDTEREKQIEEHKKKNGDKGPSYPKGAVISLQLEKKRKSSDITNSKKIEPENEKEKTLDSIEKRTVEEPQENKLEEVKGENNESVEEKPSEEEHDSKPENAESISNDIGETQIAREDLKQVFGKFARGFMDFGFDNSSIIFATSVNPLKRGSPSIKKESATEKKAALKHLWLRKKWDQSAPEVAPSADPKFKKSKSISTAIATSMENQVVVTPEPSISKGKSPDSHLEVRIPKEGRRGLIWKQGLLNQRPDSLGIYLPGYTKMLNPIEKSSGLGEFSREVFRTIELPYMQQKMKEDPGAVLSTMMGHIYELGSVVGYMKDDLASREGNLKVSEVSAAQVAKAVMERDYWRNHAVDCRAKLELTQRELTVSKNDLEALTKEMEESSRLLDKSATSLAEYSQENLELSQKLETLKAENEKLNAKNKSLTKDLAKSAPKTIKRFLKSIGFKCAAQLAMLDIMRYTIYREMKKLGTFYPFVPEQIGYTPVALEQAIPKDLSEYKWDEEKDRMIGPDGEQVLSKLKLETCDVSGVVHCWDKECWPYNVHSFDTRASEVSSEERAGTSRNV